MIVAPAEIDAAVLFRVVESCVLVPPEGGPVLRQGVAGQARTKYIRRVTGHRLQEVHTHI